MDVKSKDTIDKILRMMIMYLYTPLLLVTLLAQVYNPIDYAKIGGG